MKAKEQHLKLTKCLDYIAHARTFKMNNTTYIFYVRKEYKENALKEKNFYVLSQNSDYIYDLTHYEWLKQQQPIPELTHTEKLLYDA